MIPTNREVHETIGFVQETTDGYPTVYVIANPPTWRDIPRILAGRFVAKIRRVQCPWQEDDSYLFMNTIWGPSGSVPLKHGEHPAVVALEVERIDNCSPKDKGRQEDISILVGMDTPLTPLLPEHDPTDKE